MKSFTFVGRCLRFNHSLSMKTDLDIFGKKELSPVAVLLNLSALRSERSLSREEYLRVCERFPDLHIEREKDGTITVMSPVKRGSGKREISLMGFLFIWVQAHKSGELHGPSSGFDLPDGSTKQPDAAWISPERLAAAESDDEDDFIKTVPDFVGEVRSSSDSISALRKKMANSWIKNGVRLGWLIDPYAEKAYIYRQGQKEPEVVEGFSNKSLSGEDVMKGFKLELSDFKIKRKS